MKYLSHICACLGRIFSITRRPIVRGINGMICANIGKCAMLKSLWSSYKCRDMQFKNPIRLSERISYLKKNPIPAADCFFLQSCNELISHTSAVFLHASRPCAAPPIFLVSYKSNRAAFPRDSQIGR